jgi:putative transcription antitermination factor YqgF
MPQTNPLPPQPGSILALDVGAKRIGVARASTIALLPEPLTTLETDENINDTIQQLIDRESARFVVQNTLQTQIVRGFADKLSKEINVPVYLYNETGTSKMAEEELENRKSFYEKGDIDALAATFILEGFIESYGNEIPRS